MNLYILHVKLISSYGAYRLVCQVPHRLVYRVSYRLVCMVHIRYSTDQSRVNWSVEYLTWAIQTSL